MAAAVVVGTYLITLLRHADRVSVACQAQLANVIAPIRTEPGGPAWRQTIFHPFAHAARWARGDVLRLAVDSPTFAAEPYGDVPVLDTVATHDGDTGEVTVLAVNRGLTEPLTLTGSLHGLGDLRLVEHLTLAADGDARRTNTREHPDAVVPRTVPGSRVADGALHAELPPLSWNVLRLAPAGSAGT